MFGSKSHRIKVLRKVLQRTTVTDTGCMEWTGARAKNGYGRIRLGKHVYGTHRVIAHLMLNLPKDSPLLVCHHCDNPPCLNPDHLFIGKPIDNIMDAVRKGRMKPVWLVKNKTYVESAETLTEQDLKWLL